MPTEMTFHYAMGGFATQDYYTEEEMSAALEISPAELRAALDPGEYGPRVSEDHRGYCFHMHPLANGGVTSGKFLFTRHSYLRNIRVFQIRRWLQANSRWDTIAFHYLTQYVDFYKDISEKEFDDGLVAYRSNFLAKNTDYHYTIRDWWQFHPFAPGITHAAGRYTMMWWQTEQHPWRDDRERGESSFASIEDMLAAARTMSPYFQASLFAPGYSLGSVTNDLYGRRWLVWRVKVDYPQGRTWCEECGCDVIGNDGKCTQCGGDDMIRTATYEWDNHREVL